MYGCEVQTCKEVGAAILLALSLGPQYSDPRIREFLMTRYDLDEIAAATISPMFRPVSWTISEGKAAMSRGNPSGLDVSIERPRGPKNFGRDASTSSVPWVPQISREILRDLGMTDDAIAQYFCRFRHGQLEQFIQMILHKRGWTSRRW